MTDPIHTNSPVTNSPIDSEPGHRSQVRVRIRVPSNYRPDPIISTIISRFGLTVNVLAALLGSDQESDGWFDLELSGSNAQIQSALLYFNDLDLEVWRDDGDPDGI